MFCTIDFILPDATSLPSSRCHSMYCEQNAATSALPCKRTQVVRGTHAETNRKRQIGVLANFTDVML